MNSLPENFYICKCENNPLWRKYLNWLYAMAKLDGYFRTEHLNFIVKVESYTQPTFVGNGARYGILVGEIWVNQSEGTELTLEEWYEQVTK